MVCWRMRYVYRCDVTCLVGFVGMVGWLVCCVRINRFSFHMELLPFHNREYFLRDSRVEIGDIGKGPTRVFCLWIVAIMDPSIVRIYSRNNTTSNHIPIHNTVTMGLTGLWLGWWWWWWWWNSTCRITNYKTTLATT